MHVMPCLVHTPDVPFDADGASYASGQCAAWPYIQNTNGLRVDLRDIPGPDAGTHDHACLTDLTRGWVEVENPRRHLAFCLEWDAHIFRWINNWRPFGGSRVPSLGGVYGLAIEPWVARSNLAAAVSLGDALSISPHATLKTGLRATLRRTEN
jgi:hypothetical protein